MNAIEFVKIKIDELVKTYPTYKFTYAFDRYDNTHAVQILPSENYNFKNDMQKSLGAIDLEFISLFPYEGLYFISEDNYVHRGNVVYEKAGNAYKSSINLTVLDEEFLNLIESNDKDYFSGLFFEDLLNCFNSDLNYLEELNNILSKKQNYILKISNENFLYYSGSIAKETFESQYPIAA